MPEAKGHHLVCSTAICKNTVWQTTCLHGTFTLIVDNEVHPEVPPVIPRGGPDEEEASYSTTSAGVQFQHGASACANAQGRKSQEHKSCSSTMSTETKDASEHIPEYCSMIMI